MWKFEVSVYLIQAKPMNGESMYLGIQFNNRIFILKIDFLLFMIVVNCVCDICMLCDFKWYQVAFENLVNRANCMKTLLDMFSS